MPSRSPWSRLVFARRRWRRGAPSPQARRRAEALARAAAAHPPGPARAAAWAEAHAACQSMPLLHARAHLVALGDKGLANIGLNDVMQVILAPLSGLLRRAAGLQDGEAGGPSLRATWAKRGRR